MNLTDKVMSGDRLALARLLSHIENETEVGLSALNNLFAHTGHAHLIGVTGAPGTGKSTLVNKLVYFYRHPPNGQLSRRVAIVATDPSSPFSGGAILGDRIRMRDLAGDPDVFIRSMASRGSLGGLANATSGVVQALDAAGFDTILIETVGAGQGEVEIARLAHTTLVVEAPGLGDDIQAIKAGIMEIADILVVNKADHPGVRNTVRALRSTLKLAHPTSRRFHETSEDEILPGESLWIPPVITTIALDGTGIPELAENIECHRRHLESTGNWSQREQSRLISELENLMRERLMTGWRESLTPGSYEATLERLFAREISPHQAVDHLLGNPKVEPHNAAFSSGNLT
ncbi:MAG: methylmalonyl Co-A mutase-associated GTPase MeaB [Chloroflexota bacterium]